VIDWIEEEDRSEVLNSASDAGRAASRQYWSTLESDAKPQEPTKAQYHSGQFFQKEQQ
jgi:hypothetical protein